MVRPNRGVEWAVTTLDTDPGDSDESTNRLRGGGPAGCETARRRAPVREPVGPVAGTADPRLPAGVADQRLCLLHRHALGRTARVGGAQREDRAGTGVGRSR